MFLPIDRCWVCDHRGLARYHEARFDFQEYARQDPELHAYTGRTVWLVRCARCGFGQPEALPTLPRFFERMYDQRWSEAWIDREFEAGYKDFVFGRVLRGLARRARPVNGSGALLDVGAHAGRFMHLAARAGWRTEGIELNPGTAACAARRTGATVHQANARALALEGREYDAVTAIDVLEHIPDPVALLTRLRQLVRPGGVVAVKVPSGDNQWRKERVRAALRTSRRVSIADNLVHVNHFTPRSLTLALERAGFDDVEVGTGAPELVPAEAAPAKRTASNILRLAVYAVASLPGGVHTPLALNLQAYAARSAS